MITGKRINGRQLFLHKVLFKSVKLYYPISIRRGWVGHKAEAMNREIEDTVNRRVDTAPIRLQQTPGSSETLG